MDEEGPNCRNVNKFMCRIRNVIEVTRQSEELTGVEVIGALETIKLDVYSSLPKEEVEDDEET